MANLFTQSISIAIVLKGANDLSNFLHKTNNGLDLTAGKLVVLNGIMRAFGATIKLVENGMKQAISTDKMVQDLSGITQSASLARNQMLAIDAIAAKGIFNRDDIFKSVFAMDRANTSLNKYLGLTEKLGMRTGNMKQAADFMNWFKGSPDNLVNSRLFRRLEQFGITAQMLKSVGGLSATTGGVVNKGGVEKALFTITSNPNFEIEKMQSAQSAIQRLTFQWERFQETIARPMLGPLTKMVNILSGAVNTMKILNTLSHGILGVFAVGGALIAGLIATWRILKGMQLTQMFIAIYSAIIAACAGNFIPLGAVLASGVIAGGLVYGADKIASNYSDKQAKSISGNLDGRQGADRPIRHDDTENLWHRMQGRAWAG